MTSYRPHIQTLEATFTDLLKDVPGLKLGSIKSSADHALLSHIDIDLPDQLHGFELPLTTANNETWHLVVQVRASGEPRLIRESCARLQSLIALNAMKERIYPVVAATFIGKKAAEICKEYGVGYLDLSGNCRLAFGSIFISKEVSENKNPEKRPLRSLFSAKSSRIIRLMLENPERGWQVQELAESGEISLGLASKVKQKLLDQDLARATNTGLKLKDPESMLLEWSQNYSYKDNEIVTCYAPGEQYELEGYLSEYCTERNKLCALTLFSGSNRLAPFVRGISLSSAYVDGDIKEVASDLGWKPVSSGANFMLMRPDDEYILRGVQTNPQKWLGTVVSDIQLYLDLASYKTRGQEAAEHLLSTRIQPSWQLNSQGKKE